MAKQNKVKYGHGSFEFRSWDLTGPIQDGDIRTSPSHITHEGIWKELK